MNLLKNRLILLLSLLIFYCAIPTLIFIFAMIQIIFSDAHQIDEGEFLTIVVEISTRPGVYLNIIHQMILPTVAAITVVNNVELMKIKGYSWLFLVPLVTILVCIINALIFNVYAHDSLFSGETKGVTTQFFVNIAGNLSIYVMMMVGLNATNK